TTIRMLLGLIKPTFGQVEIFGENLFNNKKSILRRIGSIVEVPGFYENLTARENLLINAKILGVHKKNTIEERSEEHTSELQSRFDLVCRLLLEKKNRDTSSNSTSLSGARDHAATQLV